MGMNMGVGMGTSSAVISTINTDIIITINLCTLHYEVSYKDRYFRSEQLPGQALHAHYQVNEDSIDPAIHFTLSDHHNCQDIKFTLPDQYTYTVEQ